MGKLKFAALSGAILLVLGLARCGSGDDRVPLSGSIRIDSSRTVAPLTTAMAKRFMAENPGVHISVRTSGTDGSFEKLCHNETDAGDAPGRVEAKAIAACQRAGVEWGEIAVANDAVILVTNLENPITCLTTAQLSQIWRGNSKVTTSWSQVSDIDPPYDGELVAWGPGTDTETYAYFTEAVNHNKGETRDYNDTLDEEGFTVDAIARIPGGIGYVVYSLYKKSSDTLKALQVDSGDGCVAPTPETIADGTFRPLARRLFIYPSAEALARPAMDAFLKLYLDNIETAAPTVGFIALTDEQLDASKATLERLIAKASGS